MIEVNKPAGLYDKFIVSRTDNSTKHRGCAYFVLDATHDPFAVPALEAYANACESSLPKLADDIRKLLIPIQRS